MVESLGDFLSFGWLIEALQFDFFRRGLLAVVLAGVAGGLLSAFVVWRGMSFLGDALAHVILPGIVIAQFLGANLLIGALIASLLAVLGIGLVSQHRSLKEDTSIGIVFVGFFALGIILNSLLGSGFKDLTHILFGNALGINETNLWIMLALDGLIAILVIIFFKELLVTSFDPSHSVAIGLSPTLIHFGLLIAIALTTVVTIQSVGVVLVLALLISPAAIAGLFTKRLRKIVGFSVLISVLSSIFGYFLAHVLQIPVGPSIVMILFIGFLICLAISQIKRKFYNRKLESEST
jgi:ABC-type Mn2+/Zn2+ transport system permease subunit